jgi:hypothetical protein
MATPPSDRIAEEQSALCRVATLVARAAPPEEVFSAEIGQVLSVGAGTTVEIALPVDEVRSARSPRAAGSRTATSG